MLLAFATPSCNYVAGSNTFGGSGLQFSSDFGVVKSAISLAHNNNPNLKILLSVGGATYPWSSPNYDSMVALMKDLDLDGLDIDFEDTPSCTGVDSDSLKCSTDEKLNEIINTLSQKIPSGKMLTAAVFSVGAYGTKSYPTSKYTPASQNSGLWVNPLKNAGSKLNEIFIMSYDASPAFSPNDAFDAYKAIFNGGIHIGLEVPPEAWGGYVLTVDDALKYATHAQNNGGKGVFIWSFEKSNGAQNSYFYLNPICNLYGAGNCSQTIPEH